MERHENRTRIPVNATTTIYHVLVRRFIPWNDYHPPEVNFSGEEYYDPQPRILSEHSVPRRVDCEVLFDISKNGRQPPKFVRQVYYYYVTKKNDIKMAMPRFSSSM